MSAQGRRCPGVTSPAPPTRPGPGLLLRAACGPKVQPWFTGSLIDAVSPGLPLCTGFLEQHLISNQAFISRAFKGPSLGGCGA